MRTVLLRCGWVLGFALSVGGCPKAMVTEPGAASGAGGGAGMMATAGSGGIGGTGAFGGIGGVGGTGAFGGIGGTGAFGGVGGTGGNGLNCGDTYQRPVDVLFVIDNSGSMREEQQSLREQIPRMIATLNSGVSSDGTRFIPVSDLHVGVVSTDMGLLSVPGRAQLGCGDESRPLGDDGVLRSAPNPGGVAGLVCAQGYPPFLSFVRSGDVVADEAAAATVASDFSCMAALGTTGCGFEMQLESALRGLWPSDNTLINGQPGTFAPDNRPFLDGTPFGKGAPAGPNAGFLRNSDGAPSLLAIVMVTDEEDCSSHNLAHFVPEQFLQNGDPLKNVGLNIRCHNESTRLGSDGEAARDNGLANLYATSRYAQAFKALRPGSEHLVVFAGIVGVPADLVTTTRINGVDFSNPNARDAFYDSLLADSRMVETIDFSNPAGNPNLVPSCLRVITDEMGNPVTQKAYPPRRILKVAREIGENAVVQSICQDDFTPAIDNLLKRIGNVIRGECPLE